MKNKKDDASHITSKSHDVPRKGKKDAALTQSGKSADTGGAPAEKETPERTLLQGV